MQIRSKLTFSTLIVALLLLSLGGLSFTLIFRLANISQEVADTQKHLLQLQEAKGITENIYNLTELHVRSEDGVSMGLVSEKIEELEGQLNGLMQVMDHLPDSRKDNPELKSFQENWSNFGSVRKRVIGLSDLFFTRFAEQTLENEALPAFHDSHLILDNQIIRFQQKAETLRKRAVTAKRASMIFIVGFTIIIVMLMVLGGLVMTRSITNPLLLLADYLRSYSLEESHPFKTVNREVDRELQELIQSLEIQVKHRTEELQKSNKLLENEIEIRKRKEEQIKSSEKKYRQIFNNSAAWMAYTTVDGAFLKVNIALMEQLGYSESELKSMNLKDLIPDRYYSDFERFIEKLHTIGKASGLMTVVSKAGDTFILDYQSNIIAKDPTQETNMAIHIAKDITREKEAEWAFEQSELRFREMVNALPLSYIITDSNLNIVFANRKTLETFHTVEDTQQKEFIGSNITGILKGRDSEQQVAIHASDTSRDKTNQWDQYVCRRGDGSEFPCEVLTTPVKHHNRQTNNQHIVVDISERLEKEKLKKQKEVAEEANKAISDWLNFVAHELRNPLSGIMSFARFGVLKTGTVPNKKIIYYFEQVSSAAVRLERLLTDLLDLSKMEMGNLELNYETIDLHSIINEVKLENEALLLERNLNLAVQSPEDMDKYRVHGDRFRLGQVFRNIISNAIKFTPPQKTISVSLKTTTIQGKRQADKSVPGIQVDVRDEGIGIPEDQLELVFNKFRQSRKSRIGEGTGLGLPICKEIVETHGGNIWVQSVENEGTVISFSIPVEKNR